MEHIRQATLDDVCRIAEILVFNYRINFYPSFENCDEVYFKEWNVFRVAKEYQEDPDKLSRTYVYDDGVIRGFTQVKEPKLERLFVDPQFQNQKIGGKLLTFALNNFNIEYLNVLEYNKKGMRFYERYGFHLTAEKIMEDGWVPLYKMSRV